MCSSGNKQPKSSVMQKEPRRFIDRVRAYIEPEDKGSFDWLQGLRAEEAV